MLFVLSALAGVPLEGPTEARPAALLVADGRLVAFGELGEASDAVWAATDDRWTSLPSLPAARSEMTVASLSDGSILAVGGLSEAGRLAFDSGKVEAFREDARAAFLLRPGATSWTSVGPLPRESMGDDNRILPLPDGTAYVLTGMASTDHEAEPYRVARWTGTAFEVLAEVPKTPTVAAALSKEGLVVVTQDRVLRLEGKRWKTLSKGDFLGAEAAATPDGTVVFLSGTRDGPVDVRRVVGDRLEAIALPFPGSGTLTAWPDGTTRIQRFYRADGSTPEPVALAVDGASTRRLHLPTACRDVVAVGGETVCTSPDGWLVEREGAWFRKVPSLVHSRFVSGDTVAFLGAAGAWVGPVEGPVRWLSTEHGTVQAVHPRPGGGAAVSVWSDGRPQRLHVEDDRWTALGAPEAACAGRLRDAVVGRSWLTRSVCEGRNEATWIDLERGVHRALKLPAAAFEGPVAAHGDGLLVVPPSTPAAWDTDLHISTALFRIASDGLVTELPVERVPARPSIVSRGAKTLVFGPDVDQERALLLEVGADGAIDVQTFEGPWNVLLSRDDGDYLLFESGGDLHAAARLVKGRIKRLSLRAALARVGTLQGKEVELRLSSGELVRWRLGEER